MPFPRPRPKRREGGFGCNGLTPAEDEATFGGGTGERQKGDLGREVLRLGRCHERGTETGADEADAVGAGPDFFGDARGDTGTRKRGQNTVIKTRIMRARKQHERSVGEVAEA